MQLHINEFQGCEITAAYTQDSEDLELLGHLIGRSGNAVAFVCHDCTVRVISAPRQHGSVVDFFQAGAEPEIDLSKYFA